MWGGDGRRAKCDIALAVSEDDSSTHCRGELQIESNPGLCTWQEHNWKAIPCQPGYKGRFFSKTLLKEQDMGKAQKEMDMSAPEEILKAALPKPTGQ